MALRTPLTAQPHLYIGDSTGRPLDYGRVYFGEPNKDPEFYPIDIYLDPEMTIAAAQPVRTKGGFMDVGGNLAELHAAEVIYSLKVLDQYGRQVFYKPEMYRNNVSDFLADEIIRATAAETLIAGNLTAETQRAIAAEKEIANAVVAEKDRAVAAENALDIKHAALSSTINSLGGGKKAYTTYALMVADKNNIAANSSIDVTNDTDPLKNGTYSYDGAVFAKSIYDVETIVRTKVLNTFKTKSLMDASALPDGADAQVTNDTANNGLYVKTSSAWVKSSYDPLKQAKDYVDEKIKISLDDPEYLLCIADSDSNLLFAITRQGEVLGDFKVLLENITDFPDSPASLTFLTIEDNVEGELYEIADSQGNILAQVESDGTWVVPAIRTTTLDSTEIIGGNLNLGKFNEAGITKEKFIRIPEQNYLRLDLDFMKLPTDTSAARTPTSGTCTISDSSKSIVYVRTNAKMAVQGNGSAGDKKPNYTIGFYNIDGDGLDLKFGDTIASDSYHLKGFYRDPTHMRDQGGYRCWKELVQKLDYPYSKINNIVYSASPSRPTNAEFTADAKYYPHGFPVEVYLNGQFYGLYTLRLKKSRNNYALDNSNTDHIFLDSGTYTAFLKEPFDATDWEIKSPKMKGYNDLGLIPPAFTKTVGASCTRLFEFTSTLSTSYPNHADYIVLPHWVLWYLMCELTGDWDHDGNNYNIITWNSQQWSIIPYDLDWTLNWYTNGFGNPQSTSLLSSDIWTTFRTVFAPEIKALWTKHRKNGDITVENVAKHYRSAVSNVPREIYKADKDKWGSFSTFDNVNYPDLEQVYRWFEARIEYLDSKYLIV